MSEESAPNDVVQYCYNCASLGHFGDVSYSQGVDGHVYQKCLTNS